MDTIRVGIRFVGTLRGLLGKGGYEADLEKPGTVAALLHALNVGLGPEFRDIVFDRDLNDPRPNVLILVNGREIGLLDGIKTVLKEGDVVTILPVSHGG
ncbi:MAG: MoaD/ThiS family protein [Candidatus Bathyarchaeia archaeon]